MAEACYTPKYFTASFKGVTFEALEAGSEHGRRGAVGEHPFRDAPSYVDLGRKARTYSLSGRLATNDHLARSKRLIAACETGGPGSLVHPSRGAIRVACTSASFKDDLLTGQGVTTFDLQFVEAGSTLAGFSIGASLFGFDITAVFGAIQVSFSANFTTSKIRLHNLPVVTGTVTAAMAALKLEFAKSIGLTGSQHQYQTLSTFDDIIGNPAALKEAKAAFDAMRAGFDVVANNTTGNAKFEANRRIANQFAKNSTLSGVAGTSQDAVFAAIRNMAGVNMAVAALDSEVTTLNAALQQYDQILGILDGEMQVALAAHDDALFLALRKFTSDIKPKLLERAYSLPALITYRFNHTVHSLVAAYELWNDAKRFGEIEARNTGMPFQQGQYIVGASV